MTAVETRFYDEGRARAKAKSFRSMSRRTRSITWGFLGLFVGFIVGFLVGCSVAYAAPTHQWCRITWTNPDSAGQVASFRMYAYDDLDVIWFPPLHADTLTSSPPPTWSGLGQRDTAYVYVPISQGRQCMYFLVSGNAKGEAISNPLVLAPARPDTNYLDTSVMRWGRSDSDGFVRWRRASGDSSWAEARPTRAPWSMVPLVTSQEALQLADQPTLCAEFGAYALRGALIPCAGKAVHQ